MYPFQNLSPRIAQALFAELTAALPPPLDDSAEAETARDLLAMGTIAALGPVGMHEALLAIQITLADAHARASLRQAVRYHDDVSTALRCRAIAASMARLALQARRMLDRLQQDRANAPAPVAEADAGAPLVPEPPRPPETSPHAALREAERFALRHPYVARDLRRRAPVDQVLARAGAGVTPPDPVVLTALLHANSPVLAGLETLLRGDRPAA